MRCPKCDKKCYIVRTRKGDVVVEQWYCSNCFWEDKEGKFSTKDGGVVLAPDATEVST
jgi:hypothetical protein